MTFRAGLLAVASLSVLACFTSAARAAPEPAAVARAVLPAEPGPISYEISITPNAEALTFDGVAKIEFETRTAIREVRMNALDLDIRSASLSGGGTAAASLDAEAEQVLFTFGAPVAAGRHTLTVAYSGKISETANGLFTAPYKTAAGQERTMLVTQFEPGDARRLAPMWDEPARKAVFNVNVVIPAAQSAISNMPATSETAAGPGLKRITFAPSPKMSSYLLFLGVGELDRLQGSVGSTQLGLIAKAGDADKGAYALAATRELLPYFNDYFGTPYPLPKLDQIAVPGAGGFGAMENWGAILYFEPVLLFDPALNGEADRQRIFSVVAHEVAHQWFGNLVTMSWWDDLWLNEGYASWMETKAMAHFHPEWKPWLQALGSQEGAMDLDARSSSHPIIQNVPNVAAANQAFDAITYQKGEAVIRMLEAYVGEDAFRAGVRAYMQRHAYANTVTDDLWTALEQASKSPVRAIAHDFTRQAGVPLITVEGASCRGGRTVVRLRQGRFGVDAPSRVATTWRVPVTASLVGNTDMARSVISGRGEMTLRGCGPVVVNRDRTGYFRVSYDAQSFDALKESFAKLHAGDQLALLYDTWALGASGDGAVERYLELAARTPADADPVVQRQIIGQLNDLRRLYRGEAGEADFRTYALSTLNLMFARVGWTAAPGEAPNVALLRSSLIGSLARFGDADVIAEARRRFASSAPSDLPPALRSAVISAVGASADATTWTALQAKAKAARSPLEQRQFLGALAAVSDPALAQRSLALFLSDATPKQLGPNLINGIASRHPDLAWSFYQERRAEIEARLDPLQRDEYGPGIAAASTNAARAPELRAFAAANLSAEAEKPVSEAVSEILQADQIRRERLPAVSRWLAAR